jgi:glycosyltransferase involved in cell wall biosynthesis
MWRRVTARVFPETSHFSAVTQTIISALTDLKTRHNIDVFEIEESFGWSLAISRSGLLPVVVRLHGPWFLSGRYDQQDPARRAYRQTQEGVGIREAHFVTSPSVHVLAATKSRYQFELPASRIIANPILSGRCREARDVLTLDHTALLFVGRFDALKGGDLIVRAFATLAAMSPRARLTFVGRDIGLVGVNGRTLKFHDFVREHVPEEYRSRITFRGEVPRSEVMDYRWTHFATVIASQYEVAPYSVLEPMSLGCPIVATAVGGISELIKDQRNGLLVEPQNLGALVAACRSVIEDTDLAVRLGRQAWLDCRRRHDPEIIAQQTVAAYAEAVEIFKSRSSRPTRYFKS